MNAIQLRTSLYQFGILREVITVFLCEVISVANPKAANAVAEIAIVVSEMAIVVSEMANRFAFAINADLFIKIFKDNL
ncbi:MAG: hypothetical protein RMY34_35855 [Aulosira sp. DedQUE10]|nr:hypothetical protein [Aulosira sp. DedQUE10]